MLTVRVNWGNNSEGFPLYSVYIAEKYTVDTNPEASKPDAEYYTRLLLDDGKHDIRLGKGSRTFVMNTHGATVDTIVVN